MAADLTLENRGEPRQYLGRSDGQKDQLSLGGAGGRPVAFAVRQISPACGGVPRSSIKDLGGRESTRLAKPAEM